MPNICCQLLCAITARLLILSISPRPKISGVRARTRKAESATLLTASPYKADLERKQKAAAAKPRGRKQKQLSTKDDVHPPARQNKCAKRLTENRCRSTSAAAKKSRSKRKKTKIDSGDSSSEDEEWPCLVCGEPFANSKAREKWIQCQQCRNWAHEACTDGSPFFTCPNCDSD